MTPSPGEGRQKRCKSKHKTPPEDNPAPTPHPSSQIFESRFRTQVEKAYAKLMLLKSLDTGIPPLMHIAGSPRRVSKHGIMRLGR
jgi:hypothetical protein